MVRKIEYELDDVGRVSPSTEQKAGVQGDHRATKLEFKIPISLIDNIEKEDGEELKYRFDVYTGAGTYKNYTEVPPSVSQDQDYETVSLPLEEAVTRYGGKITVVLLIVGIRNDSTEHIVQSFPVQLKLAQKPSEGGLAGDSREELITILVKAEAAKEEALVYSENARTAADEAIEAKEAIENLSVSAVGGNQTSVEKTVDPITGAVSLNFTINETALTEEQMTAINSGISAQKVAKYDGYDTDKQDTLTDAQLSAVNSGITADKVAQYDGQTTQVVYYYRSDKTRLYKDANLTVQATFNEVKADLDDRTKFVYVEDLNANNYHECLIPTHLSASVIYFVRNTLTEAGEQKIYKLKLNANGTVVETSQTAQQKLIAGTNITIEGNVISVSGGSDAKYTKAPLFNVTTQADITNDDQHPYTIDLEGSYQNVFITVVDSNVTATESFRIAFLSGTKTVGQLAQSFSTSNKGVRCELFDRNGFYATEAHPINPGNVYSNDSSFWANSYYYSCIPTEDKITSITLRSNNSGHVIHAGTIIKVWACEASGGGGTVTDAHINDLIDAKLGVIENGSY